jgi:hypothetical protein
MRRTAILSAVVLLGATACNAQVVGDGTGGAGSASHASSGAGPASGATTGASSSSGGGTGGSGAGGSGAGTVTLTMTEFPVPAGGEVYMCQNFANPFGGMDAQVQEFESHMALGSHHMLLFYEPGGGDAPIAPCSGLEFAPTPYGSQIPNDSLTFPPGVAALVPGADGFRIQAHYLNTTADTITAKVELTFHLATPGSVMNEAAVLFVIDPKINIAPSSTAVVSDDCTLPQDMSIIRASSHMHEHGTAFDATIAGTTVFQTSTWNDPKPALYDPAMVFHAGDPLHFACTFQNNTTSTLTFGESALTNEMCIFLASFYPAPAGQATIDASNCVKTQMP